MADIQEFLDKFDRLNVSGSAEIVASKTKALEALYSFVGDGTQDLKKILKDHRNVLTLPPLPDDLEDDQVSAIQCKIAQKYADLLLSKPLLVDKEADINAKKAEVDALIKDSQGKIDKFKADAEQRRQARIKAAQDQLDTDKKKLSDAKLILQRAEKQLVDAKTPTLEEHETKREFSKLQSQVMKLTNKTNSQLKSIIDLEEKLKKMLDGSHTLSKTDKSIQLPDELAKNKRQAEQDLEQSKDNHRLDMNELNTLLSEQKKTSVRLVGIQEDAQKLLIDADYKKSEAEKIVQDAQKAIVKSALELKNTIADAKKDEEKIQKDILKLQDTDKPILAKDSKLILMKKLYTKLDEDRKALETEKSKPIIDLVAIKKAITTYQAQLAALNKAVTDYNQEYSSQQINSPTQKPYRMPSKGAKIASNLIADFGEKRGWNRAIVTDKEQFFKERKIGDSESHIEHDIPRKNVYINLSDNECYVVSKVYKDKSTADLIQDSNGAITLKSEKLSDEGKQEQALEAALMAIKNYPGKGCIRINSSLDSDMAERVHVALIALAPHIEVKNFACEKPNVKTIFGNLDMDKVRSKKYLGPALVSDKYNELREEVKDILKAKATLRGDTEKFRSNVQTDREAVKQQIAEATQEGEEVVKEGLRKK